MRTAALLLLVSLLWPAALRSQELKCLSYDATQFHTVTLTVCDGGKMYYDFRKKQYTLVCPGYAVPEGSVEMRPYYPVG